MRVRADQPHAGQPTRLHQWRELRREALVSEERDGGLLTTVWDTRSDGASRLEALIEAERECCAFLDFEVEKLGHLTRVRTLFPPGAEQLLDSFMEDNAR